MTTRKPSASATGGPMLNPSVEPKARRESAQARRDSGGNAKRASAERTSAVEVATDDGAQYAGGSVGTLGSFVVDDTESLASAAALEARNHRRSVGLQRLSLNDHMKQTIVDALENVTRDLGTTIKTTGIEKLQDIMTEAKGKGLGVSKLFQFFLMDADSNGGRRGSITTSAKPNGQDVALEGDDAADAVDAQCTAEGHSGGGIFKDTQASKIRAEASRVSRTTTKKKSHELMPSLQKTKRPSTASSKRGSGSRASSAQDPRENTEELKAEDFAPSSAGWRRSLLRRTSLEEEAMMRDRLITTQAFQHGLNTLGFKITDEETVTMFRHMDANGDGKIDLSEFTRFCIEIPSIAWKAERARRGILANNPGVESHRELDKAARDIANEAVLASDIAEGVAPYPAAAVPAAPRVTLGETAFKGEKFFWRTKDLIQVVIQLNSKQGFIALSTFHTDTREVYPIIFVDPKKIPIDASGVVERRKELEDQALERKQAAQMGVTVGDAEGRNYTRGSESTDEGLDVQQSLAEKANMLFVADYLMHRLSMPDSRGNLLQPDITQPGVQVNPDLPSKMADDSAGSGDRVGPLVAKPRPGLMKTTFDEWDTLLFHNPPSNVADAPSFAKTKKRQSYFEEFLAKQGEFDEDRVKAHRLSAEAEAYTEEVSNLIKKLAPLNYSASAPAALRDQKHVSSDHIHANVDLPPRRGSGRIVLEDELAQSGAKRSSLLESQSAPVLPTHKISAA